MLKSERTRTASGRFRTAAALFTGALAVLAAGPPAHAAIGTTIDFEGRTDGESITTQYTAQGVTFSGNSAAAPTILDPSPSYYPANSGTATLWKPLANPSETPQAPIVATFSSPQGGVSVFVSNGYGSTTLTAYDSANNVIAADTQPGPNYAGGPAPANALLSVTDPNGTIMKVVITSSADGSDFVIDDFSFTPPTIYTYYADSDGDGYGDPGAGTTSTQSTPPSGYVTDNTDCDDNDATVHPGAPEICDGKDNNCNGTVDEGLITPVTTTVSDAAMNGWATVAQRTGAVHPLYGPDTPPLGAGSFKFATGAGNSGPDLPQGGAGQGGKAWLTTQLYDGTFLKDIRTLSYSTYVETRMSGTQLAPSLQFQLDLDNDGSRDTALVFEPVYSPSQGSVNIGQWQTWDALTGNWWYTSNFGATLIHKGADTGGVQPLSYYLALYPNAKIVSWNAYVDGYGTQFQAGQNSAGAPWTNFRGEVDNFTIGVNCDENVYDFERAATTYYADSDGDGYGDPGVTVSVPSSTPPTGYVANNTDCNDTNAAIHPGAVDVPNNGIDEDCNGCDATTPTQVTVTPAALQNWDISTGALSGSDTAASSFDLGPATPPLGAGSLHFTIGANGDSYVVASQPDYGGVSLKDIGTLTYSTFVTSNLDVQAPYISLRIDTDNDGIEDDRLYFEPAYQSGSSGDAVPDQGDVTTGVWQTWDALHGGWWTYNTPPYNAGGPPVLTIAHYLLLHPDAKIVNATGVNGFRVIAGGGAGSWGNFDGNVDALQFSTCPSNKIFDFDLTPNTYYRDADGDGYGDPSVTTQSPYPTPPSGYVADNTDCNDNDASIHPGAVDIPGDGIDQDCNGCDAMPPAQVTVKPGSLSGWTIGTDTVGGSNTATADFAAGPATAPKGLGSLHFAVGSDGDSYGLATTPDYGGVLLKDLDTARYSTYVTTNISGQAPYLSFRIDNNNDGIADDRLYFEPVYQNGTYSGDPVPNQGDVTTGAWQTWNALAGGWWTLNEPGYNAFGPPLITIAHYVQLHPNAKIVNEAPNDGVRIFAGGGAGAWDNFDGNVDDLQISACATSNEYDFEPVFTTYYRDADNDGYGDPGNSNSSASPTPPSGYVTDNTDCDDNDATVHPGAPEICDGKDNDCNGTVDDNLVDTPKTVTLSTWNDWGAYTENTASYAFVGGPGTAPLGNGSIQMSTGSGTGSGLGGKTYVGNDQYNLTKLSDITALSYSTYVVSHSALPGGENFAPTITLQVDKDGGGTRDAALVFEPVYNTAQGTVTTGTWQNWDARHGRWWFNNDPTNYLTFDQVIAAYPNAQIVNWYARPDGAGIATTVGQSSGGAWADFVGAVDDVVIRVDCAQTTYDFEPTAHTYYRDADGDTYGDAGNSISSYDTTPPSGYVTDNTDCDDTNPNVHPGATEILNGMDDNCNGQVDEGFPGSSVPFHNNVGIKSSPSALNGVIYFGDEACKLHAVNSTTGLEQPGFPVTLPGNNIRSRPAVYYYGPTAAIYVLTDTGSLSKVLLDGTIAWTVSPPGAFGSLGPGTSANNVSTPGIDPATGEVIAAFNDSLSGPYVAKFANTNGATGMRTVGLGQSNGTITSIASGGGNIYVGLTDGVVGDIFVLNGSTLVIRSSFANGEDVTGAPLIAGQNMYLGTLAGNYYRLNSVTAAPDITFNLTGVVPIGEPIKVGAFSYLAPGFPQGLTTFVKTTESHVFSVSNNGAAVQRFAGPADATFAGLAGTSDFANYYAPVFADGSTFYQLNTTNFANVKSTALGGVIETTPTLDNTAAAAYPWGRWFFGGDDGNLYAVRVYKNGE